MPVWIGETNPYVNKRKQSTAPLTWLRQLICVDPVVKRCRGNALRADGYAHHPYDFARAPDKKRKSADEVTLANIGKLSKVLRKNRKRIKIKRNSLYLTEFAYYSSGPNAQPEKRRSKWTQAGVRRRAEGRQRPPAPLLPARRPGEDARVPHRAGDARRAPSTRSTTRCRRSTTRASPSSRGRGRRSRSRRRRSAHSGGAARGKLDRVAVGAGHREHVARVQDDRGRRRAQHRRPADDAAHARGRRRRGTPSRPRRRRSRRAATATAPRRAARGGRPAPLRVDAVRRR